MTNRLKGVIPAASERVPLSAGINDKRLHVDMVVEQLKAALH